MREVGVVRKSDCSLVVYVSTLPKDDSSVVPVSNDKVLCEKRSKKVV